MPKTETSLTELLAADAAKIREARERAEGVNKEAPTFHRNAGVFLASAEDCEGCRLARELVTVCDIATRQRRALEILWDVMVLDFHPGEEPCAYCVARDRVRAILEGKP